MEVVVVVVVVVVVADVEATGRFHGPQKVPDWVRSRCRHV